MQIIKFHKSLIKYLKTEIPKKKSIIELYSFLKGTLKIYLKTLLRLYINFCLYFELTKQRKKQEKYNQYRKDLANAWRLLNYMTKRGKTRTERKQVRRDFEKYGKITKELERQILQDLYGIKRR